MSVREASSIPNSNLPNVSDAGTQSTDSAQTQDTSPTQSTSTTSFWDQERSFQADQNKKRQRIDKTIGDKTVAAASPLDADGGKEVSTAAGKAGMTVPSKQMLSKVSHAVKDNPQMKDLQNYVSAGLHGQDPSFNTPQGIAKAQSMAANIAQSTGLVSDTTAAAFGGTAAANTSNAASSTSLGAAAPQTQQLALSSTANAQSGATSTANATLGDAATTGDATTADTTTAGTTTTGATTASPGPSTSDASSPAWLASGNITSIVMLACAASLNEDNKIKAGRLNDMQKFNKISALISGYISNTLQPAQAALDKKTEGLKSDDASQARVSVDTWSNVDPDSLFQDGSGNFGIIKQVETERLTSTGLGTALQAAQGWAQTASNNSEQASNRFQAVDNQTNQTFTMLTGFLKAINDSNSAVIRNYA